ncbi:MAG: trypsin [Nitrososphaeraceae archaeon]|nr:trypsin [Nitrososphaeraceae archaeon]
MHSLKILILIMAVAVIVPVHESFFAKTHAFNEPNSDIGSKSLNTLFESVKNSIVQITKSIPSTNPADPINENKTSLGTGFIYDNLGHIVTNNHVVENAKLVDVTFMNGDRYVANVTGTDLYSDLAVIKIIDNTTSLPQPLLIGNSSELRVGDQVIAIGNPFGLEGSMTTGIVSQIGRLLSVDQKGFSIPNAIQTDALINPGNSGGPLLNTNGEVVGVNTAGIFPSGIGLAVPSNAVTKIIPILIKDGNYSHPWLGITGSTVSNDIVKREGLDKKVKGIIVDSIIKSSPADKAGINGTIINQYREKHGGDVVIAMDGKQIIKIEDLISYLETDKSVNDNITLSIIRDSNLINKTIQLEERPKNNATK